MNKTAHLTTKFNELFGEKPTTNYFSPGRINLIGEHTDYNGGHVFLHRSLMALTGCCTSRRQQSICLLNKLRRNRRDRIHA